MSLQFSNTEQDDGIIQVIEQTCGFQPTGISSNPALLKQFTGRVNRAYDDVTTAILQSSGTWQWDDSNHTDYPFITTNLVQGQRDYTFTTDEQGNLILDIYRVMVKNESGIYDEIYPVDQQSDEDMSGFYSGLNQTGMPTRYDKTANGIFLDAIPSYNSTAGLKVFINREAMRFTISDTTKMPGFDGRVHELLALKASYPYVRDNRLSNLNDIVRDIQIFESNLKKIYRDRGREENMRLTPITVNSM